MASHHSPRKMTFPEQQSWFVTLPLEGAARAIGKQIVGAFANLGIPHKTFDCKTFDTAFRQLLKQPDEAMVMDLVNQALIVGCLDSGASHLLALALSPVTAFASNLLRKQGIHTTHWFYEDFRRATYWKHIVGAYDLFACVQEGPLPEACAQAGSQFTLLQTAVSIPTLPAPDHSPEAEVAFIGIPSSYRVEILEHLASNGVTVVIGGSGWDAYHGPLKPSIVTDQWIGTNESYALLQRAKTGLNLSVAPPQEDPGNMQISPRVYDVLYARRILITEDVPLAGKALDGCSYETFATKNELLQKVREVSKAFENLGKLREENRRIVETNHTFENRIRQLMHLTATRH